MAGEEIRATLRGVDAHLGQVRARDLARLIEGLESALAAAAYAALRQPRRSDTGRHRAAVEAASRLTFSNVVAGSVVTVFALPTLAEDTGGTLAVGVDDLAGAAFDRLMAAFDDPDDGVDPDLARELAELADSLAIGERHDALLLESDRGPRKARLDQATRSRMRKIASAVPPKQPDVLVGTLREADFDRRTARLRTASAEVVMVEFPAELADSVQEALRAHAEFEGVVTYDPKTASARRVDLRRITRALPLPFDPDTFWSTLPVEVLAEEQGVGSVALDGPLFALSPEERQDLLDALADLDA